MKAWLSPRTALWALFFVGTICSSSSWSSSSSSNSSSSSGDPLKTDPIQSGYIIHPDAPQKRIEFFWTKPSLPGSWPLLLLIHGHQPGLVEVVARGGIVAVSLSQPGYGNSDGPADFVGPYSQKAVIAIADHFRSQNFVKADRVGIYGYSRGAILASMAATWMKDLSALMLGGGVYYLAAAYKTAPDDIRRNIEREAGTSESAFLARSALYHVEKIASPVLILHGEQDDRAPVEGARRFAEALRRRGRAVRLVTYPEHGHGVPNTVQWEELRPYLREHLLK